MSSESNARDEAVAEEHGFVWDTVVDADGPRSNDADDPVSSATDGDEGDFEWCEPVVEADSNVDTDTDADAEFSLDPSLTTETRLDGTDDEAIALLAALRRDPTYGRWRRVRTDLGGEAGENG